MRAENAVDSLYDSLTRKFETGCSEPYTPEKRSERIRQLAATIYTWILRADRPWYQHPKWHVWHWKIQVHPLLIFKRWAFSRCSKCGSGFRWVNRREGGTINPGPGGETCGVVKDRRETGMRVIIAGSRDIPGPRARQLVSDAINACGFSHRITEVIEGGCRGIDSAAYDVCNGLWPVTPVIPDWKQHGKAAGPIRNRQMAEMADALIAIWDGESRGTKNMIDEANARKLEVYIHRIDLPPGAMWRAEIVEESPLTDAPPET